MNAFASNGVIANAVRRLENAFPGYFNTTSKRNHYVDFGYPETITFNQFHQMFRRNGIAKAAIEKTILKSWQDNPSLQEDENPDELTPVEQIVADNIDRLRFWQKLAEADRRALVGGYSGLILRFADDKPMSEPVEPVPGGIEGLAEIIPAWAGQLEVSAWHTDSNDVLYGRPSMFTFKESAVGGLSQQPREFELHPDRVHIWSDDNTVHCDSYLSPGYNDLITVEKIIGAGGEGFWKNAKSAPILQIDKDASIASMANAMGVAQDELADAMDKQVTEWQKGFDALLMLQGMDAKTLGVTLPQPAEFLNVALQSFAASIGMPIKILVGMQTGERASQEDAREWSQTNMSRRSNFIIPNIRMITDKLVGFGVLPDQDWRVAWSDLTESQMSEKIDRADKMAGINVKHTQSGGLDPVFTEEEIRQTVGFDPIEGDANA